VQSFGDGSRNAPGVDPPAGLGATTLPDNTGEIDPPAQSSVANALLRQQ
jgi:hypothetical protein